MLYDYIIQLMGSPPLQFDYVSYLISFMALLWILDVLMHLILRIFAGVFGV